MLTDHIKALSESRGRVFKQTMVRNPVRFFQNCIGKQQITSLLKGFFASGLSKWNMLDVVICNSS